MGLFQLSAIFAFFGGIFPHPGPVKMGLEDIALEMAVCNQLEGACKALTKEQLDPLIRKVDEAAENNELDFGDDLDKGIESRVRRILCIFNYKEFCTIENVGRSSLKQESALCLLKGLNCKRQARQLTTKASSDKDKPPSVEKDAAQEEVVEKETDEEESVEGEVVEEDVVLATSGKVNLLGKSVAKVTAVFNSFFYVLRTKTNAVLCKFRVKECMQESSEKEMEDDDIEDEKVDEEEDMKGEKDIIEDEKEMEGEEKEEDMAEEEDIIEDDKEMEEEEKQTVGSANNLGASGYYRNSIGESVSGSVGISFVGGSSFGASLDIV